MINHKLTVSSNINRAKADYSSNTERQSSLYRSISISGLNELNADNVEEHSLATARQKMSGMKIRIPVRFPKVNF